MSWFGFGGKKKKQKPEEAYKIKLDQLDKLGYKDRTKNLGLLKLYAGDVNHVIQDYQVQQPSSQSISPKQPKKPTPKQQQPPKQEPQPKQEPKQQPKPAQKPQPKQAPPKQQPQSEPEPKPQPQSKPQPTQPSQPKQAPKQEQKQDTKPAKTGGLPPPTEESEPSKPKPKSKIYSGAKMAEAKLKTDNNKETEQKKALEMLNNLNGCISSDIRQLLINIGEPQMGEIILSNGINGKEFYNYEMVNTILKKFNCSFADTLSYNQLVHQVEMSFKKNGAVDIYNKSQQENKEEKKEEIGTKTGMDNKKSYEELKNNISNLISSDVRLLIQPYNIELSERLYAYSINGSELCTFDYETVCFVTGIKGLTKENWNKIVNELKLPQTQKFDKAKWNKVKQEQEAVINKAKNIQKKAKNMQRNAQKSKPKPKMEQKEEKAPPQQKKGNKKLHKQQMKQLNTIIQMEKQTDKFLPQNLQKLKARQLQTLTTLHDIASIMGINNTIINEISQSARRQSKRDLENYLRSVDPNLAGLSNLAGVNEQKYDNSNTTEEELERRQLQLLSTINKTRQRLKKMAADKGISLDELANITTPINVQEKDIDVKALDKQLNNLLVTLSTMAGTVRETAKKHNVKINNNEIDQHLPALYNDLEIKQNNLIAKLQYLNDQARMINPQAVQVNEEILHISGHAHTRSLSGPLHLSVPHSPGESPTPHDHFPDTTETKLEYEYLSEHPSNLQHRHSRSSSLSAGIVITSPVETEREANQVRQRRKSLQINSVLLKSVLNKYDKNNNGYLSNDEFVNAVKEMNINMNKKDMKILNDVSDNKGVNVKKLISYVEEQHLTLKLNSNKQWNSFRMKIISAKQKK